MTVDGLPTDLDITHTEKDLGVFVDDKLKIDFHIHTTVTRKSHVTSSRPFVGRLWSLGKLARLTVCSDARCAVEGVCTSTDCRVGQWIQVSSVAVCYPRCVEGSSWDRNREIMCTAWYSWRPYKICK